MMTIQVKANLNGTMCIQPKGMCGININYKKATARIMHYATYANVQSKRPQCSLGQWGFQNKF